MSQEHMGRELETAAEIQTGMLPTTIPPDPGLDPAAPSRAANEVGGDFYDMVGGRVPGQADKLLGVERCVHLALGVNREDGIRL